MLPKLVRGLLLSCHPLPCLVVTVFASAYALVAGGTVARLVSIAVAVLAGQLCVGWSNDAIDGRVDLIARRPDKPIAQGLISRRTVAVASALAGIVCVALSLRLGLLPALLHIVAVLSALSYNAGIKSTVLSPLPYLIAFGLLPVVTTIAVDDAERPAVLIVIAAAMLGVAAHFGNTVGDAQADAATGVRGLPQRLGPRRSQQVMAGVIAAAAAVLLADVVSGTASPARTLVAAVLLVTGAAVALSVALLHIGEQGGHAAWRLTLLSVAIVVSGFFLAVA